VGKNYKACGRGGQLDNAMELGEVETLPGVGACLLVGTPARWVPTPSQACFSARPTPLGRTTDTYAYDLRTAASYANAGSMGEGIYTTQTASIR